MPLEVRSIHTRYSDSFRHFPLLASLQMSDSCRNVPNWIEAIAESFWAPLAFYLACTVPLSVYIWHDLVDSRWRRMQFVRHRLRKYFVTHAVCTIFGLFYTATKIWTCDYEESFSTVVFLLLSLFGFWKLVRTHRILKTHEKFVQFPVYLSSFFASHLFPTARTRTPQEEACWSRVMWKKWKHDPFINQGPIFDETGRRFAADIAASGQEILPAEECRYLYVSSALFDNDYPGDLGARVRWYTKSGRIAIKNEDADDCAIKMALYMRCSMQPAKAELWTAMCATNRLVTSTRRRVSLGKLLLRFVSIGVLEDSPPHAHAYPRQFRYSKRSRPFYRELSNHAKAFLSSEPDRPSNERPRNPIEHFLNEYSRLEANSFTLPENNLQEEHGVLLRDLGVHFFWIAAEQTQDAVMSAMALLPPRWTRSSTRSGKDLVLEMSLILILTGTTIIQACTNRDSLFVNFIKDLFPNEATLTSSTEASSSLPQSRFEHAELPTLSPVVRSQRERIKIEKVLQRVATVTPWSENGGNQHPRNPTNHLGSQISDFHLHSKWHSYLEADGSLKRLADVCTEAIMHFLPTSEALLRNTGTGKHRIDLTTAKSTISTSLETLFWVCAEIDTCAGTQTSPIGKPLSLFGVIDLLTSSWNAGLMAHAVFFDKSFSESEETEPSEPNNRSRETRNPRAHQKRRKNEFSPDLTAYQAQTHLEGWRSRPPKLLEALEEEFGKEEARKLYDDEFTFRSADIVIGLGSLISQLAIPDALGRSGDIHKRLDLYRFFEKYSLRRFTEEEGADRDSMRSDQMFDAIFKRWERVMDPKRVQRLSGVVWMFDTGKIRECPSHSEAITGFIAIAVMVAHELHDILLDFLAEYEDEDGTFPRNAKLPKDLKRTLTELLSSDRGANARDVLATSRNWMEFKQGKQGFAMGRGSTFTLLLGESEYDD